MQWKVELETAMSDQSHLASGLKKGKNKTLSGYYTFATFVLFSTIVPLIHMSNVTV